MFARVRELFERALASLVLGSQKHVTRGDHRRRVTSQAVSLKWRGKSYRG